MEEINDPNGAMTTIFTSALSATTNVDISLTWLLDEALHYETLFSILGSETENNGRSQHNKIPCHWQWGSMKPILKVEMFYSKNKRNILKKQCFIY